MFAYLTTISLHLQEVTVLHVTTKLHRRSCKSLSEACLIALASARGRTLTQVAS